MTNLKALKVKVDPNVYEQFREIAHQKGISVAAYLRVFMFNQVQQHNQQKAA